MLTIHLTETEARALLVLANEGAEAILTDAQAVQGYLGGKQGAGGAKRAIRKIEAALEPYPPITSILSFPKTGA